MLDFNLIWFRVCKRLWKKLCICVFTFLSWHIYDTLCMYTYHLINILLCQCVCVCVCVCVFRIFLQRRTILQSAIISLEQWSLFLIALNKPPLCLHLVLPSFTSYRLDGEIIDLRRSLLILALMIRSLLVSFIFDSSFLRSFVFSHLSWANLYSKEHS